MENVHNDPSSKGIESYRIPGKYFMFYFFKCSGQYFNSALIMDVVFLSWIYLAIGSTIRILTGFFDMHNHFKYNLLDTYITYIHPYKHTNIQINIQIYIYISYMSKYIHIYSNTISRNLHNNTYIFQNFNKP